MIPTQLLVGTQADLDTYTTSLLKNTFCSQTQSEDCYCSNCRKIAQQQHHGIIWLAPEKGYKTEDIAILFERTRFALDDGQKFYFIFERAHTLNIAAANRLLKVFEEPPAGYHFILQTNNEQAILPTIRSRCHITHLTSKQTQAINHPLLTLFTEPGKLDDPFGFQQELFRQKLSDNQSNELLNELYLYYAQQLLNKTKAGEQDGQQLSTIISFLLNAQRKPAQSGSSSLFWKNLFMRFPR